MRCIIIVARVTVIRITEPGITDIHHSYTDALAHVGGEINISYICIAICRTLVQSRILVHISLMTPQPRYKTRLLICYRPVKMRGITQR